MIAPPPAARAAAASFHVLARTDRVLWVPVGLLAVLGLVMVYSASLDTPPHPTVTAEAVRHGVLGALGIVAMLVAARMDYRLLRRFSAIAYLGAAGLLVAVVVIGESEYGARRWLAIGGSTIQPAEAAKLALVLALASYTASRPPRAAALAVSAVLLALLAAPVLAQPDTGTTVVLVGVWVGVMVAWGVAWRTLGVLFAVAGAAVPLAYAVLVPDYQRERLAVFLDPARDPLGSGFSLRQVEAALATGGVTGEGLFRGAESHLASVSARSSDFIFALVGEELGLVGGLGVITLFGVIAWRGFEAARHAPDGFGRMLAAGLTTLIVLQAFVNVAVNVRLFPATGLPMPFVSAGGSALLVMFVAVGLLQSVHSQRMPEQGMQAAMDREG
ncbi:MAG: hypothetical protein F4X80_10495 [Chloroflexi bacterium]|nr:hypothetical protein [Chloroflexota bacterium]